jgi:hypothetical protein
MGEEMKVSTLSRVPREQAGRGEVKVCVPGTAEEPRRC